MSIVEVLLLVTGLVVLVANIWKYRVSDEVYENSFISVSGPLIFFKSNRGKKTIGKIAKSHEKGWYYTGWIAFTLISTFAVLGILLLLQNILSIGLKSGSAERQPIQNPKNMLVIPGVNDFLPLESAGPIILALAIGIVLHELGHAIFCKLHEIGIDSVGLVLLGIIPMGAFVARDEEGVKDSNPKETLQMVSAGVFMNAVLVVVSLVLLIVSASLLTPASGAAIGNVQDGSPADKAGLSENTLITSVNGTTISSNDELKTLLSNSGGAVRMESSTGETFNINRKVIVRSGYLPIAESGDVITHVNGQKVSSVHEFEENLNDRSYNRATINNNRTIPFTASVPAVTPDGTQTRIFTVDGVTVHTKEDIKTLLENMDKNTVTITHEPLVPVTDGTRKIDGEKNLTVSYLQQFNFQDGVGGIDMFDTGIRYYPSETYLAAFGSTSVSSDNVDGLISRSLFLLYAPVLELKSGVGFTGFANIQHFFTLTAGPSWMKGFILFMTSLLFWSYWMNLNLLIFNSLPMKPLDGGYLIPETLQLTDTPSSVIRAVSAAVSIIGIAVVLFIVFMPVIL